MRLPFDNRPPVASQVDAQSIRLEAWPVSIYGLLAWCVWSVAGMACTGWVGYFAEPVDITAAILCGVPTWSVEAFA